MNVKKYLKKKAKEDLKSLQTEHDQEVLERLKNSVNEEKPKTRRNLKWLWAIPSGAVACAVAAILLVELVPRPGNDIGGVIPPLGSDSGDVRYDEANFEQEDSDFFKLSNSLTNLTLHFTENQEIKIVRFFDSLSGDELYYTLTITENSAEAMYSMELMIVVNENYDYNSFEFEGELLTESYSDYSITYQQKITPDPTFGLNLVNSSAKIENAKYKIYVLMYEEYSFENGMFLTVIDNTLEFHA